MDKVQLSLNAVFELANRCLLVNGCNMENAEAVAAVILAAERDGSSSHGLFRLPGYVASLRSGKVDGNAAPEIERLAPGVLQVDGGGGYAPLALQVGRPVLIEAAQLQGLAALALTNVHHFGALWIEVEARARGPGCLCVYLVYPVGRTGRVGPAVFWYQSNGLCLATT